MGTQSHRLNLDPTLGSASAPQGQGNSHLSMLPNTDAAPQDNAGARHLPSSGLPRDYRLDFFRGLSLLLIFVDHIPDNFLSYFTLRFVSFSDAAEIFYFISGYVGAMVYGRALIERGGLAATLKIYKRVWMLILAHLVLFVLFVSTVSIAVRKSGHPVYNGQLRVDDFLADPGIAMFKALTLQFQPVYLDILPLYILFLAVFPLVLMGFRRNPLIVMIPSALLYAAVQIWQFNLLSYPVGHTWYFNPLAWQFVFMLGALFGFRKIRGQALRIPGIWPIIATATIVIVSAVAQIGATLNEVIPAFPVYWTLPFETAKTMLPPSRLVDFFAMAYLVARFLPQETRIVTGKIGWSLVRCGQNSLYVFCFSTILAVAVQIAQQEAPRSMQLQILINIVGIGVILGFGALVSWLSNGGKLIPPPHPAAATAVR